MAVPNTTYIYSSSEVTTAVTSTIGSVFAGLNDNMALVIILVIGLFALSTVSVVLSKIKQFGH